MTFDKLRVSGGGRTSEDASKMLRESAIRPAEPNVRIAALPASALDALAAATDSAHGFLTAAWFRASGVAGEAIGVARADRTPIAAIPLTERRKGPLRLREVAGSYWPFKSFPVSRDSSDAELTAFLRDSRTHNALGRVWRMGPVYADDPTATRLLDVAHQCGWSVLRRDLATCFELDIARLRAAGGWPKSAVLRENRRRERRLAEQGALEYRFFTGADWTEADRDAMAAIEGRSWLAHLPGGGDTKFRDSARRRFWEEVAADPILAPMLTGGTLSIGGEPAAFVFGLDAGPLRYCIANNYDERFAKFGPGRLLLYADFARAAEAGIGRISWGAGDAGYKSEMGATPGPAILDLLFVRGAALAACLRPIWARGAGRA